jgi:hypothetical protein
LLLAPCTIFSGVGMNITRWNEGARTIYGAESEDMEAKGK